MLGVRNNGIFKNMNGNDGVKGAFKILCLSQGWDKELCSTPFKPR